MNRLIFRSSWQKEAQHQKILMLLHCKPFRFEMFFNAACSRPNLMREIHHSNAHFNPTHFSYPLGVWGFFFCQHTITTGWQALFKQKSFVLFQPLLLFAEVSKDLVIDLSSVLSLMMPQLPERFWKNVQKIMCDNFVKKHEVWILKILSSNWKWLLKV